MSHKWILKNLRARFNNLGHPVLGIGIFCSLVFVVAIALLNDEQHVSRESYPGTSNEVRIIDGDTIEFNSRNIRLHGIDAPEIGQPCSRNNVPYDCGRASKEHLEFIITGASVECIKKGRDKWGRVIGKCMADGEDISQLMVRHGWAVAYKAYSSLYVDDEEFARSNELGVWSKEFEIPSEWRKSDRSDKL